jgi:anaerobic selenocysteine-containing dehydrogenase
VILKEELYKKDVESRCTGLDALKTLAGEAYAPDAVAKLTGVDAKTIVDLARAFAGARRPVAVCGRGAGRVPGNMQEYLAVSYLNALVNSINTPGGVITVPEPEYISWPEPEMDAVASKGVQQPRVDGAGSPAFPQTRYLLNRLPKALATGAPVKVLFVGNANPAFSLVDTPAVAAALKKIPLIVSLSPYMDETAAQAHYILPNHSFLERYEDVPGAAGFPKPILGLARPVLKPVFKTRHTGDVVIQLAKAVGGTVAGAFKLDGYEACLQATLGRKWRTLKDEGYILNARFTPGPFETKSRKFEFTNAAIAALPALAAPKAPGEEAAFPLTLVPYDSTRLTTGAVGPAPFMMKSLEDSILTANFVRVEINPATARDLGLANGDAAVISTPKGSAPVKVYLFDGIMPGLVAMVRGLGHSAFDAFVSGKGVSVNALMSPMEDPGTGLEAAWGVRAKLVKA